MPPISSGQAQTKKLWEAAVGRMCKRWDTPKINMIHHYLCRTSIFLFTFLIIFYILRLLRESYPMKKEEVIRFHIFRDFIISNISMMKKRLRSVCLWYLILLMIETRKHSLTFASELSGITKSAFSKFLMNNKNIKITLKELPKRRAKIYSKVLKKIQSLPWRVAILTDSTIQSRSSIMSENVQWFNHGKGFVIGHQMTNILLFFNGIIILLPPIPFLTGKQEKTRRASQTYRHAATSDHPPRQILIAFRIRWKTEIFHKHVKIHIGFGHVAAKRFSSVESHVCLIYCPYILRNADIPGIGKDESLLGKQRKVGSVLENRGKAHVIHELTKTGGAERYRDELKSALAA